MTESYILTRKDKVSFEHRCFQLKYNWDKKQLLWSKRYKFKFYHTIVKFYFF